MLKKSFLFIVAAVFLLMAVAWDFQGRKSFSDQRLAGQISKNLDRELSSIEAEAKKLTTDTGHIRWSSLQHSFYLTENGRIIAWSKNEFAIGTADLNSDFKLKLVHTPRVDLLLYRFPNKSTSLVAVLPLRTGYEIVNRYLTTTWNKEIFPVEGIRILQVSDSAGARVCSAKHGCLFKVQAPLDVFVENNGSLWLASLGILAALTGLFLIVRDVHRRQRYFAAFSILFASLAAIRITMVQFLFPGRWMYSAFFDPKYFASSSFNASVGDFFFNALIVALACAYLFGIYPRLKVIKISARKSSRVRLCAAIVILSAAFFAFLFPYLFVESIFHDSAISIDITSSVVFDGIRVLAFGALMLGCLSSFFFVHLLLRWSKLLVGSGWQFAFAVLIAATLFVGYFLFSDLNYWVPLAVGLAYFAVLYYSNYFRSLASVGYRTFSFLLITVMAYGIQGSLGVRRFAEEKEVRSMFGSASSLINRDVLGEYLLNETAKKITDDKFILSNIASPLLTKNAVKQKIRQVHLNSYFDRYAVKVKLYHTDGSPADNGTDDFATAIKAFQNEANKTSYEGIYFIHSAAPETVKRYLAVIPLTRNNTSLGYVVLDLSSKQIVPQQVYPELLVDNRFAQALRNKNYSYAFFNKGKLMGSVGTFNFDRDFDSTLLNDLALYSGGMREDGHWAVGVEDESGRQAVVLSEVYPVFFVLANFSFLFIAGITIIFLLLVAYIISQTRQRIILNYATRIQLYIFLSFILPLVVVSAIALRMISQSNDAQLEKEVREKGIQITESMANLFTGGDTLRGPHELQIKVTEIAQASSVDANIYDASGALLASSQPTIFNNQLVMPLPKREAWEKLVTEKFNIVQTRCRIGLLDYNSLFFALKTGGKDQVDGILELPFLKSNAASTEVSVLTNILVTFVIVFICFSFFAFGITDKLTFPLRFIAKKLKTTSLGHNQPIAWKANDEIGLMVKEYNRMLDNLEQNKIDLARNEKESAWREIAQQVAHEIKNPLTPMRLTLQQMEQAAVQGNLDQERTKKSIQTMLAQVDVLNGIAGSFSAFATMPAPVMKELDVTQLLRRTMLLFENQANAVITFEPPVNSIMALGDEQLLGRIFSNIMLNALQSGEREKHVAVEVTLKKEESWCLISFRDNGAGIAEELRDKIFLPHFSTKNTGSGLGLAIAKQGIEQMGGAIAFETVRGVGTTFFVRLKSS